MSKREWLEVEPQVSEGAEIPTGKKRYRKGQEIEQQIRIDMKQHAGPPISVFELLHIIPLLQKFNACKHAIRFRRDKDWNVAKL